MGGFRVKAWVWVSLGILTICGIGATFVIDSFADLDRNEEFFSSVMNRDFVTAKECLDKGADVNFRFDSHVSAVDMASESGDWETVDWLVNHGADLDDAQRVSFEEW